MWRQLISLFCIAAFTAASAIVKKEVHSNLSLVKRDVHEDFASLKTAVESFGNNFAGVVEKFVSFCYVYV